MEATAISPAGIYMIGQGSLTAGANYNIFYQPAILTVAPGGPTPPVTSASIGLVDPASLSNTIGPSTGPSGGLAPHTVLGTPATGGSSQSPNSSVEILTDPRLANAVVCVGGTCLVASSAAPPQP
jgi:hypothetical protein